MAANLFRLVRWGLTRGPTELELAARTARPRLQTIAFSHYCELARWALDARGIDYDEVSHLPGFGFRVAALRGDAHLATSSFPGEAQGMPAAKRRRTGVPALAMPDGAVLRDSWEIADFASSAASAAPPPADAAWRAYLDAEFAPAVRLVAYHHLLGSAAFAHIVGALGAPHERAAYALAGDAVVRSMRKTMGVDARAAEAATATVRDGFARAADVLPARDSAPSTDEMAFAAFSAIMLAPPEYGGARWCVVDAQGGRTSRMLPPREQMPGALRELQEELSDTAAGKRALALYANHRL